MELKGKINNIIYKDDESGYAVVSSTDESNGLSVVVVFKNGILSPKVGTCFTAEGEWTVNTKYGKQFVAEQYKETIPRTARGIIAYLSCGLFKGIGEKFAKKIVDVFGEETMDVLEKSPDKVLEIKGVGKKKLMSLVEGLKEHKYMQEIIEFFSSYDVSTNMVMKIYRRYGADAVTLVKENPYRLCYDIEGFGFKKADEVALKMGIDRYDEERIKACVNYCLAEAGENGHTYLTNSELAKAASELLEIDIFYILGSIENFTTNGDIICEKTTNIFSKALYFAERNVFFKILSFLSAKPKALGAISIEDVERDINVQYNQAQREAINLAFTKNLMILTGGPGTGKTTVLLGLINALRKCGMTIACAAPTGMAAKRMGNVTGTNAKTIHRLLEYKPNEGFTKNEDNPLPHDVVIIDEISMVNVLLMSSLLNAIKPTAKVILVGDENQLPAIGPGNILHDMIESGNVPTVTLTEIFRQAEGSKIVLNAHNIINNKPLIINNKDKDTDFFFIKETNSEAASNLIKDLVTKRLPQAYGIKPTDIQVLSPRRKNVSCCANDLSIILQNEINPHGEKLVYGNHEFRVGDKVMQIKNNYDNDVFNGDIGKVTYVDNDSREMIVNFDGNEVTYDGASMDEVILAYASTVHKSQGSEYPIVIIPLLRTFSIMLKRNLIYTAITRAKNICIIVGDPYALHKAISDTSYERRNTMLKDWLKEKEDFSYS